MFVAEVYGYCKCPQRVIAVVLRDFSSKAFRKQPGYRWHVVFIRHNFDAVQFRNVPIGQVEFWPIGSLLKLEHQVHRFRIVVNIDDIGLVLFRAASLLLWLPVVISCSVKRGSPYAQHNPEYRTIDPVQLRAERRDVRVDISPDRQQLPGHLDVHSVATAQCEYLVVTHDRMVARPCTAGPM